MQIKFKKKKIYKTDNLHDSDLKQCFAIVRKWPWILILGLIIGLIGGWMAYRWLAVSGWQIDALINLTINTEDDSEETLSNEEGLTIAETILTEDVLLNELRQSLDLQLTVIQIRQMIDFEKASNASVLTVLVTAETPEAAEKTANTLILKGCEKIAKNVPQLTPRILESADQDAVVQVEAERLPFLLKGAAAGLLLPVIVIYLYIYIHDTFYTSEEIMRALRLSAAWTIDPKDPESINRFCAVYILSRPAVKKLFLINMTSQNTAVLIQTLRGQFALYNRSLSDHFPSEAGSDATTLAEEIPVEEIKSSAVLSAAHCQTGYEGSGVSNDIRDHHESVHPQSNGSFEIDGCALWKDDPATGARDCDDVLLILEKKITKRKHAWRAIADLQDDGVNVNGALFLHNAEQRRQTSKVGLLKNNHKRGLSKNRIS